MKNQFVILFLIIVFSSLAFGEIKLGLYSGIRIGNFDYNGISFTPGLLFNKDSKLSARLLMNIQVSYERYAGFSPQEDVRVVPDISVSYSVLRRTCSNVYIGIGFSTEFENMVTGYIPIGAEYSMSKDFSFYTTIRIGAYYNRSNNDTRIFGGIFGGDFGVIFYL